MYVENEHITITEKLPLVDDRWYCSWLDYMLILYGIYRAQMNNLYNFTLFEVFWLVHVAD